MSENERVHLLARRLQGRYPAELANVSDEAVQEVVRAALGACASLEIESEQDQFRFAALSVLISPEQKQSTLVRGVVQRILRNLDWPATKRLDFLYQHIVGRPVSKAEPDFGPGFAPDDGGDILPCFREYFK